jgi:alpha-1,3-rhamnosyl/mannosyltransferase
VHHLGYLPAGDVPALYRRATALVFPSLYEGFGAPPLEAMACGLPVAASDAGALQEVCGQAALSFDPRDTDAIAAALERIAADDALRERLSEAGLLRARLFGWRASAHAHARAYARAARVSSAST